MKTIFALAALAGFTSAQSLVSHFHVNGKAESACVRAAVNANPITDLQSDAMACNIVTKNAASKCTVQAGDTVAFEWRTDRGIAAKNYPLKDGEPVGVTGINHKGPCAVYAKKVDNALSAVGAGSDWFKISEDGVDSDGVFCTTRLREKNAAQSATIPRSLAPGDYLLRAELLTLNNAGPRSIGGKEEPAFYVGCVQVTIKGGTGAAKPEKVSIPGYVTINTPGLVYDVWSAKSFEGYPIPGPEVCVDVPAAPKKPTATTTTIAKPTWTDVIETFAIPTAEFPFKPPIANSIITEALSWTSSGYYPTWDGASWIYPSATPSPPAATGTTTSKEKTPSLTKSTITTITTTRCTTKPKSTTSCTSKHPKPTKNPSCNHRCQYLRRKKQRKHGGY